MSRTFHPTRPPANRPRSRLGQRFLSDPRILARIADAVAPASEETVLEIGPGPGGLTEALAKRTKRLICIEKDRDLVPALRQRFPAVEVVEADALKTDWHELVGTGPFVIAGNIPYNITSPLIDLALAPPRPRRVVYLLQKEVAERLGAKPGGAEYGALTVGVSAVAQSRTSLHGTRRSVSSEAGRGLRGRATDTARFSASGGRPEC